MKIYTYWKLLSGNYIVAKNNEPIWEVKTRGQARQDCRDLEAAE